MLDEAHERTLATDILMGLIKVGFVLFAYLIFFSSVILNELERE